MAIFPEAYNALRVVGPAAQQSVRSGDSLNSVYLSPCETQLATVGFRLRVVDLWEIPDAILRYRFECTSFVSCVAFSRDGRFLAAGSTHGDVHVWDTKTGQQECLLTTSYPPQSLAFGPDGSWLACAGFHTVSYFEIGSGSSETSGDRSLLYEDLDYEPLFVLANGPILVFRKNAIEAWDRLRRCIWKTARLPLKRHAGWRRRHFFLDSREERLAIGFEDGRLGMLSLTDGRILRTVSPDFPRPGHVSELTEDGVASVRIWGNTMWRAPGGPYSYTPTGLYGRATHLPRSPDGRFMMIDLEGEVAMVAVDGCSGVVRRMPFRGYAKAMCIADDRIMALNFNGELFIQNLAD